MNRIILEVSDESVATLQLSLHASGTELRMAVAAKLFELGRLSSGAAADLAGVPRVVFLLKLGEYGVDTFLLNEVELERETLLARS